jgi:hypothetical protein
LGLLGEVVGDRRRPGIVALAVQVGAQLDDRLNDLLRGPGSAGPGRLDLGSNAT